jgi:hypothetical protein
VLPFSTGVPLVVGVGASGRACGGACCWGAMGRCGLSFCGCLARVTGRVLAGTSVVDVEAGEAVLDVFVGGSEGGCGG